MGTDNAQQKNSLVEIENQEWIASLEYVHQSEGEQRVRELMRLLHLTAQKKALHTPVREPPLM